mmetsp:Transcript_18815/g.41177  ORF Transcript_18815/g.41177 Transcript_18815/m.41177 type:complete len:241 (+) Transcript_18815:157-879(+)
MARSSWSCGKPGIPGIIPWCMPWCIPWAMPGWPRAPPGRTRPISAAASACTSSMVLATSFSRRGIHLLRLRSITSLHMNLILEETAFSFLVKPCSRTKYPSISGLERGMLSRFLPTVVRSWQRASMFSSGGISFCLPRRSRMQACRIFSMIIFSLNSSPIRRMLPRVASLTFFNLYSLSSSVMLGSAAISFMMLARWAAAPSNSSWHVLSRMRRKVMGLSSPSAGGNSARVFDSFRQRRA